MNPCALGWDNHRKFSKVSLMEQTPEGEIRGGDKRCQDKRCQEPLF